MPSIFRSIFSLRVAAAACAVVAFTSFVACGSDDPGQRLAGGSDLPGNEGPCRDGAERACGITLRRDGNVVDCLQATQVCHAGAWGECGEKGPVTTKQITVPPELPSGGGLATKGLAPPSDCTTNPCNPYCKTFADTVPGVLDGGPDGLVYGPEGGISVYVPPPPKGGEFNLDGDPFGKGANWNGPCTKNADCNLDQYCKIPPGDTKGTCTSYKPGEFNDKCVSPPTAYGAVQPKMTCNFVDPTDAWSEFEGSVVTGQFDPSFTAPAAMVAHAAYSDFLAEGKVTTEHWNGKIKIITAKTCKREVTIPDDLPVKSDPDTGGALWFGTMMTPLLADLNGDGVPEIIVYDWGLYVGGYYRYRLFAYSVAVSVASDKLSYKYFVQPYAGWKDPAGKVGRAWQSAKNPYSGWTGSHAALMPLSGIWDSSGPSVVDLDNDGKPEIVANGYVFNHLGQLVGLRPVPPGHDIYSVIESWGSNPVLGDFDLDGKVELIERTGLYEAGNFSYTGSVLTGMKWNRDAIFKFPTAPSGATRPSSTPNYSNKDFQAFADFGAYGSVPASYPEMVWVSDGLVRIMAVDGTPVIGFGLDTTPTPPAARAVTLRMPGDRDSSGAWFNNGGGGSVTIADFDGDGLPEFGTAGTYYYVVWDIDCLEPRNYGGKIGKCDRSASFCDCLADGRCPADASGKCGPGILWARRTQDFTSFVTGSSVFDFNGDGKAEVAYSDECWTRIYDGATGAIHFSQKHSSGTKLEQPTVADVNLDGRADLIVSSTRMWESVPGNGIDCSSVSETARVGGASTGEVTDRIFAGLPCTVTADCPTGSTCGAGYCRCTADSQCGGDFKCIDPPASIGGGRTCRATRNYGVKGAGGVSGIQVWSGPGPGWAQSRYTWHQHAYTPPIVTDKAQVKATLTCSADQAAAWSPSNPRDNSFRQQLQIPGTTATGQPDLTLKYPCKADYIPVCNRGAGTAPPGVMVVGFPGNSSGFEGSSDKMVTVGPCYTTVPIKPGECIDLFCPGAGKGTEEYMVNPSCQGNTCKTNADCKSPSTCDPSDGHCTATCTKSGLKDTPPIPECPVGSGSWSFVHAKASDACGAPAPAPATFRRLFTATCPSATRVRWGLFTYDTTTPVGSNVTFNFRTGADATSVYTNPATLVARPGYHPVGSTTATTDPQKCLATSSPACFYELSKLITPNTEPYLLMEATLNPASSTSVPTLWSWNVTYDCMPSE